MDLKGGIKKVSQLIVYTNLFDKGDNRINANCVKEVVHIVSTVVFVTNWLKVNAVQENVLYGEIFIALNTFRCILFG